MMEHRREGVTSKRQERSLRKVQKNKMKKRVCGGWLKLIVVACHVSNHCRSLFASGMLLRLQGFSSSTIIPLDFDSDLVPNNDTATITHSL